MYYFLRENWVKITKEHLFLNLYFQGLALFESGSKISATCFDEVGSNLYLSRILSSSLACACSLLMIAIFWYSYFSHISRQLSLISAWNLIYSIYKWCWPSFMPFTAWLWCKTKMVSPGRKSESLSLWYNQVESSRLRYLTIWIWHWYFQNLDQLIILSIQFFV